MNEIYIEQNKPENLKLICAFRQSYYKAKRLLLAQLYITVILTVCFSTAKFLLKLIDLDIAAYAVVYSVFVIILDFFILQPMISGKRTDGAKIQEEFDSNLFNLPWNKIAAGKKVEKEEIDLLNEDYIKRLHGNIEKCKDWYPEEYRVFDMNRAVLSCQKTSLVYDIRLRRRFKFLIVRNTAILSLLVMTLCLIKDLSINSFLVYVVLPLLPVTALAKKLHSEHEKSIKASSDLKGMIDDIQAKNEEISIEDLKAVQTKIYNNRKDSALIPEKLYNRLRDKLEKQMHIHAASETKKAEQT
jgi:hypothetical protein